MRLKFLKRYLAIVLFSIFYITKVSAQCEFYQPSFVITAPVTTDAQGNCILQVDYSFYIAANNGNKYVGINIWPLSTYPNLAYNQTLTSGYITQNGTTPLSASLLINNFTNPPQFYTSYFDNTYASAMNFQGSGLTLDVSPTTYTIAGVTYKLYTIHNLIVKVPGGCNQVINLKSDIWSSNSNSAPVNKAACNSEVAISVNSPNVTGTFTCGAPYNGATSSNYYTANFLNPGTNSVSFSYDIYRDSNGDGILETTTDALINSGGPVTVAAGQSFNTGTLTETIANTTQKYQNLFIVARNISTGITTFQNIITAELINNCLGLPVTFGELKVAKRSGSLVVNWTTLTENNCKEYVVEVSKDGQLWVKLGTVLSHVENGNSSQPVQYSFTTQLPATFAIVGLAFLLLTTFARSQTTKLICMVIILGAMISCLKDKKMINSDSNQRVFVRIIEFDKDGGQVYSKIAEAINE